MKKTILVAIVLIVTFTAATAAVASDLKTSFGLKMWANKWEENVKPEGADAKKFDNGTEIMAGPSISVRSGKNWFASVTYLLALDDYGSPDWFESGDQIKFERTDLDVMAGYLLRDPFNDLKIGLFAAYKTIDAPASYTNEAAGINAADVGTWKLRGPGLGVLAEKPLDDSTLLHGNVAYLFLEQEFAFTGGGLTRFDTAGWALEVTVDHFFTDAISADLGVKYQRFKGEKNNGDDVTDSFSGLTAGLTYNF